MFALCVSRHLHRRFNFVRTIKHFHTSQLLHQRQFRILEFTPKHKPSIKEEDEDYDDLTQYNIKPTRHRQSIPNLQEEPPKESPQDFVVRVLRELQCDSVEKAYEKCFQLGVDAVKEYNLYEATNQFTTCIKLIPERPDAYAKRSQVYFAKGEYNLGMSDLEKSIELNTQDPEVYYNMGVQKYVKGDLNGALEFYEKSVNLAANNVQVQIASFNNMGYIYLKQKNIEKALEMFTKAVNLRKSAKEVPNDPNSHRELFNRAKIFHQQGKFEDALQDYKLFLEIHTKDIEANTLIADCYYMLKKHEDAIRHIDIAISEVDNIMKEIDDRPTLKKWKEKKYNLYMSRAQSNFELEKLETAISDLTAAITNVRRHAESFRMRGICYYLLKQYENAIYDFTQTVYKAPTDLQPLVLRAETYLANGETKLAIKDFEACLMLNNHFKQAYDANLISNICVQLGQIYLEMNDHTKALKRFTQACDKNNIKALKHRAHLYYKLGEYEKAVSDLSKLIQLSDINAHQLHFNRGVTYYKLKRYEDCIADFTTAISLNRNKFYLRYRAKAKWDYGMYISALIDFSFSFFVPAPQETLFV